MYHSILIDGVSTWENQMEVDGEMKTVGYHLVPSKRPTIAPPPVRTEYVDIPGADSQLDYTEVFGKICYGNRTGSWEFDVIHDYGMIDSSFYDAALIAHIENGDILPDWPKQYSKLVNAIHGKRCIVILEDEPEYMYKGRLTVGELDSGEHFSTVKIDYVLEPYKYPTHAESTSALEDWPWDKLFDVDIYYGKFLVEGEKARKFWNPGSTDIAKANIKITCNQPIDMYQGETKVGSLSAGTNTSPIDFVIGETSVIFRGSGKTTVTVDYRMGAEL